MKEFFCFSAGLTIRTHNIFTLCAQEVNSRISCVFCVLVKSEMATISLVIFYIVTHQTDSLIVKKRNSDTHVNCIWSILYPLMLICRTWYSRILICRTWYPHNCLCKTWYPLHHLAALFEADDNMKEACFFCLLIGFFQQCWLLLLSRYFV